MKKIWSMLLIGILLLAPCAAVSAEEAATPIQIGDYIRLGKYDDEPIIWRLMDEDAYGKLMVSDKILFEKPFGNMNYESQENLSNFWRDSFIRAWLNSDVSEGEVDWSSYIWELNRPYIDVYEKGFLHESNFNALEKKVLKPVTQWTMLPQDRLELTENGLTTAYTAIKEYIPDSPRDGGGATYYKITDLPEVYTGAAYQVTDTMFLLDEMQVYHMWENFGDVKALMRTGYTNIHGMSTEPWAHTDGYYDYNLRTPTAHVTTCIGRDDRYEYLTNTGSICSIRPAFYLEEDNTMILSGSGTAEDPYVVTGREISVSVDGTEVAFDQSPIVRGGVVYAPLRAIAEQLGAAVSWDKAAQKVTVQMDGRTIDLTVDMQEMYVDGVMHWLPAPVILKGDRTLVPLQVLTGGFGLPAEWDSAAQTITITTAG